MFNIRINDAITTFICEKVLTKLIKAKLGKDIRVGVENLSLTQEGENTVIELKGKVILNNEDLKKLISEAMDRG